MNTPPKSSHSPSFVADATVKRKRNGSSGGSDNDSSRLPTPQHRRRNTPVVMINPSLSQSDLARMATENFTLNPDLANGSCTGIKQACIGRDAVRPLYRCLADCWDTQAGIFRKGNYTARGYDTFPNVLETFLPPLQRRFT